MSGAEERKAERLTLRRVRVRRKHSSLMGMVCGDRSRASLSIGTRREVLAGIFQATRARESLREPSPRKFFSTLALQALYAATSPAGGKNRCRAPNGPKLCPGLAYEGSTGARWGRCAAMGLELHFRTVPGARSYPAFLMPVRRAEVLRGSSSRRFFSTRAL